MLLLRQAAGVFEQKQPDFFPKQVPAFLSAISTRLH